MKLRSFTNLLFRISGSEHVSNCQSHVNYWSFETLMKSEITWFWHSEPLIRNKRFVKLRSFIKQCFEIAHQLLLNKVVILFFGTQKVFSSLHTLMLNHCSHMNCFKNVFSTFLGIEKGNDLNILIWRWTKMNEVINDRIFMFGSTNPLTLISLTLKFQNCLFYTNIMSYNWFCESVGGTLISRLHFALILHRLRLQVHYAQTWDSRCQRHIGTLAASLTTMEESECASTIFFHSLWLRPLKDH